MQVVAKFRIQLLSIGAFLCLSIVQPLQAEKISILEGNPVQLRSDGISNEALACHQKSDGTKQLLLVKIKKLVVGERISATKVTSRRISKLLQRKRAQLASAQRLRKGSAKKLKLKSIKSSIALYKAAAREKKSCGKMNFSKAPPSQNISPPPPPASASPTATPTQTATPTPTFIPAAALRSYAYATFSTAHSSLSGLASASRPWIYYNQDAQITAQELGQMPEGHRVIMDICSSQHDTAQAVYNDPRDYCIDPVTLRGFSCLWWDYGVAAVKPRYEAFYANLAATGVDLDYVAVDFEAGFSNWSVPANPVDADAYIRAIENDPRWPGVRAQLTAAGVPSDVSLREILNFWDHQYYLIYNDVMLKRMAAYAKQVFTDPAQRWFPNVQTSNFSYYHHSDAYQVREHNGHPEWLGGDGAVLGTNQAPVAYGVIGGLRSQRLDGVNLYNPTPFNAFRWNVNGVRASVLSAAAPTDVWIAPKNWGLSLYYNNDFYQELLLHILLSGAKNLLYWNPRAPGATGLPGTSDFNSDRAVSDTMNEFDDFLGFVDRQSLVEDLQWWGDDYVISCMSANRQRICRWTPESSAAPTVISQDGERVIAATAKVSIAFEQGSLIAPTTVAPLGRWVVQPLTAPEPIIRSVVSSQ